MTCERPVNGMGFICDPCKTCGHILAAHKPGDMACSICEAVNELREAMR